MNSCMILNGYQLPQGLFVKETKITAKVDQNTKIFEKPTKPTEE